MTKLYVASLVHHQSPFISQAASAWEKFCDGIIIHTDTGDGAWHAREPQERAALWGKIVSEVPIDDWVLILDDDMIPSRNPKHLLHPHADGIAFALYDLWSYDPLTYRNDRLWSAHLRPRVWAFKMQEEMHEAEYDSRSIHCGHLPAIRLNNTIVAPDEYSLLHHAYATDMLRQRKYQQYSQRRADLTAGEWHHVESIMDKEPITHLLHIGEEWPLRF